MEFPDLPKPFQLHLIFSFVKRILNLFLQYRLQDQRLCCSTYLYCFKDMWIKLNPLNGFSGLNTCIYWHILQMLFGHVNAVTDICQLLCAWTLPGCKHSRNPSVSKVYHINEYVLHKFFRKVTSVRTPNFDFSSIKKKVNLNWIIRHMGCRRMTSAGYISFCNLYYLASNVQ